MSACLKPGVSNFLYLASPTNRGERRPAGCGAGCPPGKVGFHVDVPAFVQLEALATCPRVVADAEGFSQSHVQELLEDPVHVDQKGGAGHVAPEQFQA